MNNVHSGEEVRAHEISGFLKLRSLAIQNTFAFACMFWMLWSFTIDYATS